MPTVSPISPISPMLVKTWIFLNYCDDRAMKCSRLTAKKRINKYFGSLTIAEIYVEQATDKEIEVIVI